MDIWCIAFSRNKSFLFAIFLIYKCVYVHAKWFCLAHGPCVCTSLWVHFLYLATPTHIYKTVDKRIYFSSAFNAHCDHLWKVLVEQTDFERRECIRISDVILHRCSKMINDFLAEPKRLKYVSMHIYISTVHVNCSIFFRNNIVF